MLLQNFNTVVITIHSFKCKTIYTCNIIFQLGLWVCLIYSCLQGMGVPTECGTGRSVYLFRTAIFSFFFFANFHCHTLIVYLKMIVLLFFLPFLYTAYKPIYLNKVVFIFSFIYFSCLFESHVCFVLTFFKRVCVQELYWSSSQMQHMAELTVQSGWTNGFDNRATFS